MADKSFRSKSRTLALAKVQKVENEKFRFPAPKPVKVFTSVESNFIAWIGSGVPKDDLYGFKNVDISESDLSVLVNAKLLIIFYTRYSGRVRSVVNFAYEYGVPILWIDFVPPPKDKAWFFNSTSRSLCWELICRMAE